MSLLEDVFLEDEAGEAQELERVIEGDEFDERPEPVSGENSNENSEKEDEAEEDKRRVDPTSTKTKRVSKNPRFVLNPARLTGPRGIQVIPDHFKDFKFKGKGHEKEDLDLVLKKLEHWAYRLYPKFQFEDCLKKIETLGKKRPVMVHLHKIRSDQYISDDIVVQNDSDDDSPQQPPPEQDEFDKLLQQQIELARSTPGPHSAKKPGFGTPRVDNSFSMPKATSSPSISDEQKERMLRNRRLAEERRLARLKNAEQQNNISIINEVPIEVENHYASEKPSSVTLTNEVVDVEDHHNKSGSNIHTVNEVPIEVEYHHNISREHVTIVNEVPIEIENKEEPKKKQNRSNVIDSSDDDCEELVVNQSVTVDVHNSRTDVTENHVELKKRRSNKIDSSDEEEIVNRPETVDDVKQSNDINDETKSKHSKSNVIHSSDDEEELAVDKSVSVDMHEKNPHDLPNNRYKSPNKEAMNVDEDAEFRISGEISQPHNEHSKIADKFDINNEKTNNKDSELREIDIAQSDPASTDNNSDLNINSTEDMIEKDENNDNTPHNIPDDPNITEELKNSTLPLNNKENIDANINMELMDVDFNDDF